MTPEQIERLKRLCELPAKDVPCQDDLRALLAEWEERGRDLEASNEALVAQYEICTVADRLVEERDLEIERLKAEVVKRAQDHLRTSEQLAEAQAEIERLKAETERLADEASQERITFHAERDGRIRAEAEIERLQNKLNTDSQNFELECRKAEIERLKAKIAAENPYLDRLKVYDEMREKLDKAEAKLAQVVELHRPVVHWRGMGHDITACNVCGIEAGWPCATMKALAHAALAASPEPSPVFCHAKTDDNRMCCGLPLPCPDHPREPAPPEEKT